MSNAPKPAVSAIKTPKTEAIPIVDQPAQDDAPFADYASIIARSTTTERTTETRTFALKGKKMRFEIYTDGREDAELWSQLSTAMMHGYALQGAAKVTGQAYKGETIAFPLGDGTVQKITVKDPAYLGSVKVFTLVAKRPAWSWTEALIMGHQLGQGFLEVCNWAADANGVTESLIRQMEEREKNAPSLSLSNG